MYELTTRVPRRPQVQGWLSLYDRLAADLVRVGEAATADGELSLWAASLLNAEARWLDNRQWGRWLLWCDAQAVLWIPLRIDGPHPATDQSVLFDDRRRLEERVWRLQDPNAWALYPPASVTRSVSAVEAWTLEGGVVLVSSALSIQMVRNGSGWTTHGRQVHRLGGDGAMISKTMLLPALAVGTPHLGWLI